MLPEDKFGKKIYPRTFSIMLDNAYRLKTFGYQESWKKQNLFYKKVEIGLCFADMRGTEEVPIWEDPRPLFYYEVNENTAPWLARRMIKRELEALFKRGCPCRLSFEWGTGDDHVFEHGSAYIDTAHGIFNWPDGICRFCGKDFKDERVFCSAECERADFKKHQPKFACAACHLSRPLSDRQRHHVSYFPEKVIDVCATCHGKITSCTAFPDLQPPSGDAIKFYEAKVENKQDGQNRRWKLRYLVPPPRPKKVPMKLSGELGSLRDPAKIYRRVKSWRDF